MGGLRSLKKNLWDLRLREQLLQTPKELSRRFDPYAEVDIDTARVMATSNARSPDGVRKLMRQYGVNDVHDLMPHLPYRGFPRRVWQRARRLLRYAMGWYGYDPVVRDYKATVNRRGGLIGDDHLINPPGTKRKRRRIIIDAYEGNSDES